MLSLLYFVLLVLFYLCSSGCHSIFWGKVFTGIPGVWISIAVAVCYFFRVFFYSSSLPVLLLLHVSLNCVFFILAFGFGDCFCSCSPFL